MDALLFPGRLRPVKKKCFHWQKANTHFVTKQYTTKNAQTRQNNKTIFNRQDAGAEDSQGPGDNPAALRRRVQLRGRLPGEAGQPAQVLHGGHPRQGPEEEDQEDRRGPDHVHLQPAVRHREDARRAGKFLIESCVLG